MSKAIIWDVDNFSTRDPGSKSRNTSLLFKVKRAYFVLNTELVPGLCVTGGEFMVLSTIELIIALLLIYGAVSVVPGIKSTLLALEHFIHEVK